MNFIILSMNNFFDANFIDMTDNKIVDKPNTKKMGISAFVYVVI